MKNKTIVMVFSTIMVLLTTDSGASNSSESSGSLLLGFDDADMAELMSPHLARMLYEPKLFFQGTAQRAKPAVPCPPLGSYSSCLTGASKNPLKNVYCGDPRNRSPECHQ